tara:strand:- start:1406 stop:1579 length:174 start_codon:yes stop_codon:yes gene_type:complete
MSYLNKIVLCFTKDKIVGFQYKDKIVSQQGDEFRTLIDFYNFYIRRDRHNRHEKGVN